MIVVRFKVQCKAEKGRAGVGRIQGSDRPQPKGGWHGQLRYRSAMPSAAKCPVSSGWSVGANLRKE